MVSQTSFTFIYSTGSAYLSVESDASRNELKIGCLGMGPLWSVADHTWDYPLEGKACKMLEDFEKESGFADWDECYVSADDPDLEWEFIITYSDGSKKRSFGNGMKPPGFDDSLARMKDIVVDLSKEIYIDLSPLEAVYFCYVRKGINCTATLYRDMESQFEKAGTPIGERKLTLTSDQWNALVSLVESADMPFFGFGRVPGSQFASRALYLGGRMVSCTYAGEVDSRWADFEDSMMKILGIE